jgi:hypothetical protein
MLEKRCCTFWGFELTAEAEALAAVTFVFLKFLHVPFMFLGTALAVGPVALHLLARSGDIAAIRRAVTGAHRAPVG